MEKLPKDDRGKEEASADGSTSPCARENEAGCNERLRVMVDGLPLLIWVLDPEACVRYVNQAFREFFGADPEEMTDKDWRCRMHPKDSGAYLRRLVECLRARRPFHSEARVKNAKGRWRRLESWGSPRFSSNGEFLGMVGASADITKRTHTETLLRKSEQKFRELNESLEKRVAERTAKLEEQTVRLRHLAAELSGVEQRERKRLAGLLHDDLQQLLVAAEMQLGTIAGRLDSVSLKSGVEQARKWLNAAVSATKDLTLELRPPALYEAGLVPALRWFSSEMKERYGMDVTVVEHTSITPVGDDMKALLFESVRELLFNVAKYAGVEQATVEVTQHEGKISLAVLDEGCGFDVEKLDRQRQGSGFGLFSVRERIRALNGDFTIRSAPGAGSRVEVEVPLQTFGFGGSEGGRAIDSPS